MTIEPPPAASEVDPTSAAFEQIAVVAAHDVRNVLAAISLRLQFLERASELGPHELASIVQKLRRDAAFAAHLLLPICDLQVRAAPGSGHPPIHPPRLP